jgi:hypothetical protein
MSRPRRITSCHRRLRMRDPSKKPLRTSRRPWLQRSLLLNRAVGSYLPSRILTNADLEKMVNTSDEWITSRTGIKERRIAAADEFTSDMAAHAARRALDRAQLDPRRSTSLSWRPSRPTCRFPQPPASCNKKSAPIARPLRRRGRLFRISFMPWKSASNSSLPAPTTPSS